MFTLQLSFDLLLTFYRCYLPKTSLPLVDPCTSFYFAFCRQIILLELLVRCNSISLWTKIDTLVHPGLAFTPAELNTKESLLTVGAWSKLSKPQC